MDRIRAIKPDIEDFYKTVNDGVRLPIKIYYPKIDNGTRVAFLIIHGGAWYAIKDDSDIWDGSNMQFQAQYYADKGFLAVAISYRDIHITKETTAFDLIRDCKDAVAYMKNRLDFDKLVIMGESAGGHLATLLGLDDEIDADVIVALNPVLDVVNKWTYVAKNDTDRYTLSPAFNVRKSDCKFLVMHGTADVNVCCDTSEKFSSDMISAGSDCKYIGIEGEVHSFIISRYRSADEKVFEYMSLIDDYLLNSGIIEVNPTKYHSIYKSNTTAGLGANYTFTSDGSEQTGRIFYKISTPGTYNYSVTFSGTLDSTYADGFVGSANKVCPEYKITALRAATVSADDVKFSYGNSFNFKNITFWGSNSVTVKNGKTVYSDPVILTFKEGDFICLEISYIGTEIPKNADRTVSSYIKDGSTWISSGDMPIPRFIGCDRKFKKSLLFIGDSITQGVGTKMDSYTHYVAELKNLLGDDYSIRNIGVGYARAKDAATRGKWLEQTKYADVVVVCLGVNDIYHDGGSTGEEVCKFYDTILSELALGYKKIIWQTVPPFDYSASKIPYWNTANDYIKNTISKNVSAVFDVVPILCKSEDEPHRTIYGQHPNWEGCKKWAQTFAPIIEKVLAI